MTTTTATTPTVEGLRTRLDEQKREVEAAELALGAAALDSPNPKTASKRLTDAEAAVQRTLAAIAELERRAAAAAEQARLVAASAARLESYRWVAEYMRRAEAVLLRRAEFETAEARLKQLGGDRKVRNAQLSGRYMSADESDLDTALLQALPIYPKGRDDKLPPRFSAERARELRQLAEALAEEEADGNGVDRSNPLGTYARERKAQRRAAQEAATTAEHRRST